jgi:hypothetical protein
LFNQKSMQNKRLHRACSLLLVCGCRQPAIPPSEGNIAENRPATALIHPIARCARPGPSRSKWLATITVDSSPRDHDHTHVMHANPVTDMPRRRKRQIDSTEQRTHPEPMRFRHAQAFPTLPDAGIAWTKRPRVRDRPVRGHIVRQQILLKTDR